MHFELCQNMIFVVSLDSEITLKLLLLIKVIFEMISFKDNMNYCANI